MNILDIAIAKQLAGGGGSGTDNYNELSNLPKINGTTLSGDKSSSSLGLQSEIKEGAELASDLVDDSESDNKFVTSAEKLEWSGKQNLIDSSHKLSSDLVDDANKTNKFVTASEKETWNGKQNLIDNSHKLSSDLVDDTNKTNKFVTSTEKNTWNAKQNAIDADHKLSSSLVSFSEAEAAALASGINSSKVGQISTNQTNILYTLNRTGKNLLDTPSVTISTRTWNTDSDGYITAADTTGDARALNYDNCQYYCHLRSGTYKLVVDIKTASSNGSAIAAIYSKTGTISTNNLQNKTGVQVYEFTISTEDDYGVLTKLYAGSWRMMICEADMYAKDSSYVPYSLPNYDLTRLQAEDRAALAEEIDAGAKNLLNNSLANGTVSQNVTATVASNGSFTLSGTASTNTDATFPLISNTQFKAGTYVGTGCPKNGDIAKYRIDYVVNDSTVYRDYGDGVEFTLTSAANVRAQAVVYRNTAAPSGTWYPMLCTKAAFGVSNKFVPYRPSWDVIQEAITSSSFYLTQGTNITFVNTVTRKCNGMAWFALTCKSSILLPADSTTTVAIVNPSAKKIGDPLVLFNASVDRNVISTNALMLAYMSAGTQQEIRFKPSVDIPVDTTIYITGSYLY